MHLTTLGIVIKTRMGSKDTVSNVLSRDARKMTQTKPGFLIIVNSRAKVQSPKIRNNNPVEPKNHTHKPGRQNGIGQRIFKTVSLRWIPTGKVFIDSTTKVDSEPPNGSNDDITNPYECNQTLYVSAGTSNSSAGLVLHLDVVWTKQFKPRSSSKDVWINRFKPRSLMSNLLASVP
ncbi:hypothetical protein Tco_0412351 [Tanacetum coccineum]